MAAATTEEDEDEEEEESGRGTFEVQSTRLTGVDQISEGEIIQGRRRQDRDKAPPPRFSSPSMNAALFFIPFPSCLVFSSRTSSVSGAPALIPKSIRKRIRSTVRRDPGARGLWRVSR